MGRALGRRRSRLATASKLTNSCCCALLNTCRNCNKVIHSFPFGHNNDLINGPKTKFIRGMSMRERRDIFQRKVSAAHRMFIAMDRQARAASIGEKDRATQWIAAWSTIAGLRQFKLERSGQRRAARLSGRVFNTVPRT